MDNTTLKWNTNLFGNGGTTPTPIPMQPKTFNNSSDILNEIQNFQNNNLIQGPSIKDIQNDYLARVNYFEPQYRELNNERNRAYSMLPEGMQSFNKQYGNDPTQGVSQLNRLNSIMQNQGRAFGNADTMADVLRTAGGNINNLAEQANSSIALEQQNREKQLGNLYNLYNLFGQREEQDRQREEAKRQFDMTMNMANQRNNEIANYNDTVNPNDFEIIESAPEQTKGREGLFDSLANMLFKNKQNQMVADNRTVTQAYKNPGYKQLPENVKDFMMLSGLAKGATYKGKEAIPLGFGLTAEQKERLTRAGDMSVFKENPNYINPLKRRMYLEFLKTYGINI